MARLDRISRVCLLLLVILASAKWSSSEAPGPRQTLTLTASKDSIVRFFYQPTNPSVYFHTALLFRVVEENDPRLETAPVVDVGRTAYISRADMERLITQLSGLSLHWDESAKFEGLETSRSINNSRSGGMSLKVWSANATAKASIDPDKICETLAPLDHSLRAPRALWEFQFFRRQYHCRVPNFNPNAYPDRTP